MNFKLLVPGSCGSALAALPTKPVSQWVIRQVVALLLYIFQQQKKVVVDPRGQAAVAVDVILHSMYSVQRLLAKALQICSIPFLSKCNTFRGTHKYRDTHTLL